MFLLSEAIVLAGTLGPQIRGAASDGEGGTCVLGGVKEVVGAKNIEDVLKLFPSLGIRVGSTDRDVWHQIIDFNDRHWLSREAIAEWVVRRGYDCVMVEPAEPVKQEEDMRAEVCV